MSRGNVTDAVKALEYCVSKNPLAVCSHLSTKTADAYYLLGWLSYSRGDQSRASEWWQAGLTFGSSLLQQPLSATLINENWPNLFDYGDGMRELIHSLESLAKCANGIHILRRDRLGERPSWAEINNTFRMQRDEARGSVHSLTRIINELRRAPKSTQ